MNGIDPIGRDVSHCEGPICLYRRDCCRLLPVKRFVAFSKRDIRVLNGYIGYNTIE
jgi:hypothetical protein